MQGELRWPILAKAVSGLILAALLSVGCETQFDAFEDNDQYFSITGYLDVNADTHFVRVELLRDSLFLGSKPLDVEVTFDHLTAGKKTTWKDSLFRFSGIPVHNFWSTDQLQPLHSYRITVTNHDNTWSSASVTLPDTFPTPTIPYERSCLDFNLGCDGQPIEINIVGVEKLATVLARYRYHLVDLTDCVSAQKVHLHAAEPTADGYRVLIDWRTDLLSFTQAAAIDYMEVYVAAGDENWPDLTDVDFETQAIPDFISNVEQGVGFLGGIAGKTVEVYDSGTACASVGHQD